MEEKGLKLRFSTGLVIVYKFEEPKITFVKFYYDRDQDVRHADRSP